MDVSIYNYKNYYNRSGKGFDNLAFYNSMLLEIYTNIQFNPNDGVSTELILNMGEGKDPDYLIVSDNGNIVSRWYVMECKRTRLTQYRLVLFRDVVVDYKTVIANSYAFIERGYLPETDPGIYNSEPVAMNQIKSNEIPLSDATNCNWIVGYFSAANTIDGESLDPDVTGDYAVTDATPITHFNYWQYYNLLNPESLTGSAIKAINNYDLTVKIKDVISPPYFEYHPLTSENFEEKFEFFSGRFSIDPYFAEGQYAETIGRSFYTIIGGAASRQNLKNNLNADLNVNSAINYSDLLNENGKIYHDTSSNKYYRISVIVNPGVKIESFLSGSGLYNSLSYAQIVNSVRNTSGIVTQNYNGDEIKFTGTCTLYSISAQEITGQTTLTKISTTRKKLVDAPYCMFCIPYETNEGTGGFIRSGGTMIQTVPSEMLNIAQKIAEKYSGAGWLYDIQILPYCPVPDYITDNNIIDISNATIDIDFNWINNAVNNKIGAIIWAMYSRGKFDIPVSLTIDGGKKVSNCCDLYRLVAPNYNASFEFSVAKNDGVSYFEVEWEYKPHNPYIHINPHFANLYGRDFNDARGLVCTGDYSLAIVSNAWTTYQLQHVNYQKIFDRQIENMDVNHTFDLINRIAGAVGGASSTAIQGAIAGTKGGPAGMAAGGIAGGVVGAVGGIADVIMGEMRYGEQKDFAKDMFAYNLQNVQALPNTLAKVSALTPTNKHFPFIEIYKPTELERQLFTQYIELKGMNVGRVDIVGNYMINNKYLKAQIIRMPTIEGDNHISTTIAAEINKGVYW